jgi:hypothetical protein
MCMCLCVQGSVKLRVTLKLVSRLKRNGHRILLFSQSRLMLDILQSALVSLNNILFICANILFYLFLSCSLMFYHIHIVNIAVYIV